MRSSYTIIELLIVIAIFALLTALAGGSASAAKSRVRNARCAANLHAVGQLIVGFTSEHQGAPAPVVRGHDFRWSEGSERGWDIQTGRWAVVSGGAGSIWSCPENVSSYVGNALALGVDESVVVQNRSVQRVNTSKWREPARLILAYDMQPDLFSAMPATFGYATDPDFGDLSNESRAHWSRARQPTIGAHLFALGPHREKYGVIFADGHAAVDLFRGSDRAVLWSGPRWWRLMAGRRE